MIGWSFEKHPLFDGWNHEGIQTFRASILESLTREIIQNSLDAAASSDPGEPVLVKFSQKSIAKAELPGWQSLQEKLQNARKTAQPTSARDRSELDAAIKLLGNDSIRVLEISDFGTTGMPGQQYGSRWFAYLKARGVGDGGEQRGGSHGIGKNAPLAASILRTIFVSSRWWDAEQNQEKTLIQGRATLMSDWLDQAKTVSNGGTGFWGKTEKAAAITESECEFDWLKRDEVGTSIFVIGWSGIAEKNWAYQIILWAAVNYFTAFYRDKLILDVEGKRLSAENIEDVLNNKRLEKSFPKNHQDRIMEARHYLRVIQEGEGVNVDETQLSHLNRCVTRFLVSDDAPRKFCVIRKNMMITDNLNEYWKRVPARIRDFAGVFECIDVNGNELIRAMEPPKHNNLSKDYLPEDLREKGEKALRILGNKLKEITEKYAAPDTQEAGAVDFLREFLADEAGDGDSDFDLEDRDPDGNFVITPKPVKLSPAKIIDLESEDEEDPNGEVNDEGDTGGSGSGGGSGGTRHGQGEGSGEGTGGTGTKGNDPGSLARTAMELKGCRFVPTGDATYTVFFTGTQSSRVILSIYEVGADLDDPIPIVRSNKGTLEKGGVVLEITANQRSNVEVEVDRLVVGGLKMLAQRDG